MSDKAPICPHCGHPNESAPSGKKAPVKAMWVVLILAWVFFLLPLPGTGIFIAGPLNLVALILAVLCLTRGNVLHGVIGLVGGLVVSGILFFVGTAGMIGSALNDMEGKPSSHVKTAPATTTTAKKRPKVQPTVDGLKSYILDIDQTTTLGKAVEGYQFFKDVKWQSATDSQGRKSIFFDGEYNDKIYDVLKNAINEEIVSYVKQRYGKDIDSLNQQVGYLKDELGTIVRNRDAKKSELSPPDIEHFISKCESASADELLQLSNMNLSTQMDSDLRSIAVHYRNLANAKTILARVMSIKQDNSSYEKNVRDEEQAIIEIKTKIHNTISTWNKELEKLNADIKSKQNQLEDVKKHVVEKEEELDSAIKCVSNIPSSIKLGKIMYHQEFSVLPDGAGFDPGAGSIIIYDEGGQAVSKLGSKNSLLGVIYKNELPSLGTLGLQELWGSSAKKCMDDANSSVAQEVPVKQDASTLQPPAVAPTQASPAQQASSQQSGVQPSTPQNIQPITTNTALKTLMDSAATLSRDEANKIAASMEIVKQPALNAKLADAFNKIGLENLNKQGDKAAALESFKKAYENDASNPEYSQNYGYVLYLTGNFDAAIQKLVESLEHGPKRASVWFSLGEVCAAKGMTETAYQCLVTACKFTRNINTTQKFLQDKSANSEFPAMREASQRALVYAQSMQ